MANLDATQARGLFPQGEPPIVRILVPVDFSVATLGLLQYAGRVAQHFGANIDLLHVVPHRILHPGRGAVDTWLIQHLSTAAQKELAKLAEVLWVGQITATTTVRTGRPADAILDEARRIHCELIVLSRRDRSWLSRWFRHHTVRQLVQRAPCPVIVLRQSTVDATENHH
jgi:nucleotide-binding universal stress UspA family protein